MPIDTLPAAQVRALAHFVTGFRRLRGSIRWRAEFVACARRGNFAPYTSLEHATHLRHLVAQRQPWIVCQLKTADVLAALETRPLTDNSHVSIDRHVPVVCAKRCDI